MILGAVRRPIVRAQSVFSLCFSRFQSTGSVSPAWVTTGLDFPGYHIVENRGIVRGVVVRSRNVIMDFGAHIQSFFGGNITIYSALCEQTRQEALDVMLQHAGELEETLLFACDTIRGVWPTRVRCYAMAQRCASKPFGPAGVICKETATTSATVKRGRARMLYLHPVRLESRHAYGRRSVRQLEGSHARRGRLTLNSIKGAACRTNYRLLPKLGRVDKSCNPGGELFRSHETSTSAARQLRVLVAASVSLVFLYFGAQSPTSSLLRLSEK